VPAVAAKKGIVMKKFAAAVAVAALSVGALAGGAQAQTSSRQSGVDEPALAERYLRAVCPVNRQGVMLHETWEAAGFGKHDPAMGTPIPRDLQVRFHRAAGASRHAVQVFRNGNWPQSLAEDAADMTQFYRILATFYGSRSTPVRDHSWVKPGTVPKVGKQAVEMRRVLGLPARGKGCTALG
jgi:hypothetical protein